MKEYKVTGVPNMEDAERVMNEMAQDGWEVKAVTYWSKWATGLAITFEREISRSM